MEDERIIELYFRRDEDAIAETDKKYGLLCHRIAGNVLHVREDAEECVADTYHTVWNTVPPQRPHAFSAFLGRITRNLAISRWRANHAKKRYAGMETMLSELGDCVPDPHGIEELTDRRTLSGLLSRWLDTLGEDDRALFVRRYWYGDSVQHLAGLCGETPNRMAKRMQRLRRALRERLEKEGVSL